MTRLGAKRFTQKDIVNPKMQGQEVFIMTALLDEKHVKQWIPS